MEKCSYISCAEFQILIMDITKRWSVTAQLSWRLHTVTSFQRGEYGKEGRATQVAFLGYNLANSLRQAIKVDINSDKSCGWYAPVIRRHENDS